LLFLSLFSRFFPMLPHFKTEIEEPKGGFSFENVKRNDMLSGHGVGIPVARKTGTTIVGLTYNDGVEEGVVLGADTRATEGPIVADKNCEKIHYIAANIYCCGAGTSADTENSTALISSQLELHRLATGRTPRLITALTMLKQMLFRYQGHVSAALILGGVDVEGASLYTIYPHGSTDKLPFVTMGSGSLNAMAVFESKYKKRMSKEEAVELVHQAVLAGIFNDLGSGGNVDITVITKGGVDIKRNYDKPNKRIFRREKGYSFPIGATPVITTIVEPIASFDINNNASEPQPMEI